MPELNISDVIKSIEKWVTDAISRERKKEVVFPTKEKGTIISQMTGIPRSNMYHHKKQKQNVPETRG